MERLPHDGDLLKVLTAFCRDQGIRAVFLLDGQPFVHAHISFARASRETLAGHLMEGTILFAGELVLREFPGPDRVREKDPVTGLNLWKI